MSRRHPIRRARARVHDERGFTILETVIAIMVVFASLTALMYTATSGFRYVALARERQAATGAATRLMEQLRALSVDTITDGMKTADIATGDSRIKTPADCGDGAYHFLTCAGEKTRPRSGSAHGRAARPAHGDAVGSRVPHHVHLGHLHHQLRSHQRSLPRDGDRLVVRRRGGRSGEIRPAPEPLVLAEGVRRLPVIATRSPARASRSSRGPPLHRAAASASRAR